jgi:NADH dehydrogenase (ubiquinone) 1 beta subcomplex subunit 8
MWGPDAPPIDPNSALRQFMVVFAGFVSAGLIIKAITPDPPAVRREYPFDGLVRELGGLEENKVCWLIYFYTIFRLHMMNSIQARPESDNLEH